MFTPCATGFRRLVLAVAALLVAATGVHAQSDTTPPALVTLSFTPAKVDTTNGDQHVDVRARITDNLSGFQSGCFYFRSPSQLQGQTVCVYDEPGYQQSGDELDGEYRGVLTLQPFVEAGTWVLYQVILYDDAGNGDLIAEGALVAAGFPTTIEVVSESDVEPPTIEDLELSPPVFDVSNGPVVFTTTLRLADAGSGVGRVCVNLISPGVQSHTDCTFSPIEGDPNAGLYQIPIVFPQFAHAGTWQVDRVEFLDGAGNAQVLFTPALAERSFPTTFEVQSTPTDIDSPMLAPPGITLTPAAVNTSESAGTVSVAVSAMDPDALSGVGDVCVHFLSPSLLQLERSTCLTLQSGDALNGVWTGEVTFPQYSEAGLWRLHVHLYDVVGNFRFLGPEDLLGQGYEAAVAVGSTTPEAPVLHGVYPGNGRVSLQFSPGFDSGSPILNYKYSIDNGQTWIAREPASTASPLVVTGLTNGAVYTVRLRAVNANGDGTPTLPEIVTASAATGVIPDSFNPGTDGDVYSIAVDNDGKVLVGGWFLSIGGGDGQQAQRINLGRLNPDGSVDATFDPGNALDDYDVVRAMVVQPDGRVVAGICNVATGAGRVVRFNTNGLVDETFNVSADECVFALAQQADGRIVVGGTFSQLNVGGVQVPRSGLARLNADGTLDTAFNPVLNESAAVLALAIQPDGRILIGGSMIFFVNGLERSRLARLEPTGAVDPTFSPSADFPESETADVRALALQPDGRILVGGFLQTLNGEFRDRIGRLNADGTVDTTFVPPPLPQVETSRLPAIETILVLPNGQILAGGHALAQSVPGGPLHHLVRYNADGTLDSVFDAMIDTGSIIRALVMQDDGRILVGGSFLALGGEVRQNIARIDIGIPGVPAISSITRGNGQLSVVFTPPAATSEFALVNYEYSLDGGETWTPRSPASAESPLVITGLTNGTPYRVAIRAVTTAGFFGGASNTVSATPAAPPGAPTVISITPGDAQLIVTFSPPAAGDGDEIINYEYSVNGGQTWVARVPPSTASPIVISGLINGEIYTVVIRAVNDIGPGAASLPLTARASTTPGAPLVTGITPGNGQLSVVFVEGPTGGLPIVAYEFSRNGGATWEPRFFGGTSSPLVIAGLVNGTSYGISLRAVNDNGPGAASPVVFATPQATADESADTFNPGADGVVRTLAVQADGRVIVGGEFTRLGENATLPRNNLGRVNADGSIDSSFNPVNIGPTSLVSAVAIQPDGRIVLGGDGPDPTGLRTYTARLFPDASFDGTFVGAANGPIYAIAVQPDGRLIIGGNFTQVGMNNEWSRPRLARLNTDGTADSTFNPDFNGIVNAIAVQPDGRILVGGSFSVVSGVPRSNLVRLNPDGSVDHSFVGGASGEVSSAAADFSGAGVAALSIQADGKILVGGRFTLLGGGGALGVRINVGRLNADGTLDASFAPNTGSSDPSAVVEAVLELPTRRILIGGYAVAEPHADGMPRHLARLLPDGTLDAEFNPRADGRVRALALQPDGRVVVGGHFNSIGGETRFRLARLGGSGPVSPVTPVVPPPFTDDPLIAGTTPLRAVHITELRDRINALRVRFALSPVSWTDSVLTGVLARAVHVQELRDALLAAYDAALLQGIAAPRPVFADAPLGPGLPIRALHIQQLRAAVQLLEGM